MLTRMQIMCMTSKTRQDFDGTSTKPNEQSIHPFKNRGVSKDCTRPARTRDGKTYPGGKHMRKALARLELRRRGITAGKNFPASMSK